MADTTLTPSPAVPAAAPASPPAQALLLGEAPLPQAARPRPHHLGHRERLRERLIESGADPLPDYELLELLLFAAQPRRDMKPVAKALMARFGNSIAEVLAAPPAELEKVPGAGPAVVAHLAAVREAGLRLHKAQLRTRPVLSSWQAVIDYCRAQLGFAAVEEFHLLFLDRKNALIASELQQRGTVDQTPVYVREVVKRALALEASAIIMVHNVA